MVVSEATVQPLPPERSMYMQRAAAQAMQVLESFASGPVEYDATALQLLDEWIDRTLRQGPLSDAERVLVIAFLGQTFLDRHGGYWATRTQDQQSGLGVVCPVTGSQDETRFIDVADQVQRRLAHGISDSLTFFYLIRSVDLHNYS